MKNIIIQVWTFIKARAQDILLCGVLVAVFAVAAFLKLGDTDYPRTAYIADGEQVLIDFGRPVQLQYVAYINGGNPETGFRISAWGGEGPASLSLEEMNMSRFVWLAFWFRVETRYIVLEPTETNVSILEMGFFSDKGFIEPVAYSNGAELLFDEPHLVPKEDPSNFNSIIFDEELYAVTAYEFIHGITPIEWTHPPLGKNLIALGINALGMTPLGWRFICALLSILMIIPIYALGKRMFGSPLLGFVAAFGFTFDFMHLAQSRVANIDTFLVTFIVCMFLFMNEYMRAKPENRLSPKSLTYLALSGVFMGLGISVKWSALFAGLGLGVLFAMAWVDSREFYAKPKNKESFTKDFSKTLKWCVLFFIVVPMAIYCISYIPFARAQGLRWPGGIIQEQVDMFNYHRYIAEDTAFMSSWWTWPLDLESLVIYSRLDEQGGLYRGINTFGNPVLWWSGFLALIWVAKRWISDNDKTARFLFVAWIVQIFPWAFISRSSYIYHYYPCVPFLSLMVAYFIKTQQERRQIWYAVSFCALAFILFVVFYPVISGAFPISSGYQTWLEWLPGWDFIAKQ
ncbi:MAG: phospholipid carrier-dependent glycosyltransferase [Oscillospiraceae bacterium]|nr:phospholipid carrier-dependent glycosyltransferase [Oscillospiraceae bacterium]